MAITTAEVIEDPIPEAYSGSQEAAVASEVLVVAAAEVASADLEGAASAEAVLAEAGKIY